MKTDFVANENHFSSIFIDSELLPVEVVFSSTGTLLKMWKWDFCLLETVLFYSELFSVRETIN